MSIGIFKEKIIPISYALKKCLLDKNDILEYRYEILPYISDMIIRYNVSFIDELMNDIEENSDEYNTAINGFKKYTKRFLDKCIYEKYMPRNLNRVLMDALLDDSISWLIKNEFMKKCNPPMTFLVNVIHEHQDMVIGENKSGNNFKKTSDMYKDSSNDNDILVEISKIYLTDEFIEKYQNILKWKYLFTTRQFDQQTITKHLNPDTKSSISKNQRLTPEFIDEHSTSLDWYELCEHQELPEWILRKHIDKLNWGQISHYQYLSPEFIRDYECMLNTQRLKSNNKMKGNVYITKLLQYS